MTFLFSGEQENSMEKDLKHFNTGACKKKNGVVDLRRPTPAILQKLFLFHPAQIVFHLLKLGCMYRLSLWGRQNVWTARILIVVSYLLLNVLGWALGEQLALNGMYLSTPHFYAGTALVLVAFFAYPSKSRKRDYKHFYRFQKTCDGVLVAGTFVLIVCLAQPQSLPQPWMGLQAGATEVVPTPPVKGTVQKKSIFRKVANGALQWLGVDKAIQKKIQKNAQRLLYEYKRSSTGGKIALIVLTVLVAVALGILVLGLSCSLSCNGSDAAAILVGVLGLGLIVFLSVKVIQRITRGPKPKDPVTTEPPPTGTMPL